LLANYQRDHGREPIAWTKESQEYAVFIANLRKQYNMGFEHTRQYNDAAAEAINKYNAEHNAWFGGENLGWSYIDSNTMLELKVGLLNAMTAMIYQDEASGNGHLTNFMNTRDGQSFGFSVQRFEDTYNLVWSFNTVYNFNNATFLTSTAQSDI